MHSPHRRVVDPRSLECHIALAEVLPCLVPKADECTSYQISAIRKRMQLHCQPHIVCNQLLIACGGGRYAELCTLLELFPTTLAGRHAAVEPGLHLWHSALAGIKTGSWGMFTFSNGTRAEYEQDVHRRDAIILEYDD